MRHPEDNLQQMCVQWFRLQYPGRLIFHIPNAGRRGGRLGLRDGVRFKKLGLLKGMLDLCIPEPMPPFHGMFIEMKAEEGKLSDSQIAILNMLELRGYKTGCCNSLEAFQLEVGAYFKKEK